MKLTLSPFKTHGLAEDALTTMELRNGRGAL